MNVTPFEHAFNLYHWFSAGQDDFLNTFILTAVANLRKIQNPLIVSAYLTTATNICALYAKKTLSSAK